MQQAGQAIEQLMRQGDAVGAFTPTTGLTVSDATGVLPAWRYLLGGVCIFAVLSIPFFFRFRKRSQGIGPAIILAAIALFTGIATAISVLWAGSAAFILLPLINALAFLALQIVTIRKEKGMRPELGIDFITASPPLLFASTWILTGVWSSLGFWFAILAYVPAVLVTWKTGWYWRLMDVVLILPGLLLTLLVALIAWVSAPTHAFPPAKLAVFTSIYIVVAMIGIWGIFGRRFPRSVAVEPSPADSSSGQPEQ
jgi:hypothetical protein